MRDATLAAEDASAEGRRCVVPEVGVSGLRRRNERGRRTGAGPWGGRSGRTGLGRLMLDAGARIAGLGSTAGLKIAVERAVHRYPRWRMAGRCSGQDKS